MKILDTNHFKEMLASGAANLANKKDSINTLNVFPVPDGDTGTNMLMTFGSGVEQTIEYKNENIGDVAKCLSRAMLMGARGNSGVILSQIFKGFSQTINGLADIDVQQVANGFAKGSKVADKAVMRPVEGTILTVVRQAAEAGLRYSESGQGDIEGLFAVLKKEADISLQKTPELLPVLKEAGVVDSGGAGLCAIFEGFDAYWSGHPITRSEASRDNSADGGALAAYCTDVTVNLNEYASSSLDMERLKATLSHLGDDIQIVSLPQQIKVHVHAMQPGDILNKLQRFGDFTTVRIQNMSQPYEETGTPAASHEKYAIITVCNGSGIEELYRSLGVSHFVVGGQTMNPSTESFVNAIKAVDADYIILLPNNSNIILAAQQAKEIISNQNISIVPSTSIIQGISACLSFTVEADLEDNLAAMNQAIGNVKTGEVTYAVKDTVFNGVKIQQNDYIGLFGKQIAASSKDVIQTTENMIDQMISSSSSIVTVIYGQPVNEQQAAVINDYITDKYHLDVQLIAGGQDIYSFIIGVE